jgi:hypothetical protein
MPRRESPFLPDQYYHFYNRGNNRQEVFFERDNYLYFLRGMRKYLSGSMDVLAYCLMPTHYHLLVQVNPQPQPQTSEVFPPTGTLREDFGSLTTLSLTAPAWAGCIRPGWEPARR